MDYPAMNERQLVQRWRISIKTLRRWRVSGDEPRWHKLFQFVRYHKSDVLALERLGAQHWSAILEGGERIPKMVTRPPKKKPSADEIVEEPPLYVTLPEVREATGLPKYWLGDAMMRANKRMPRQRPLLAGSGLDLGAGPQRLEATEAQAGAGRGTEGGGAGARAAVV